MTSDRAVKNKKEMHKTGGLSQNSKIDISPLLPKEDQFHLRWILQVSSEMRKIWEKDFLPQIETSENPQIKCLSQDFLTLESKTPLSARRLIQTVFPRWLSPIHHQWPTKPQSEGFVEKAAQALVRKFGTNWPELDVIASHPKLKRITVGLRGRLLQLKNEASPEEETINLSTKQTPTPSSNENLLVVLVDDKGLFAGLNSSRLQTGSALIGGLGFLSSQSTATDTSRTESPSRAGGKIREVLALLEELHVTSRQFNHWLELGAAPGGMTQHLLNWGAQVTAVDLAPLSPSVMRNTRVVQLKMNASDLTGASQFDSLLSDMNGPFQNAAQTVANLASTMQRGSLLIFTLKIPNMGESKKALESVVELFEKSGLNIICAKHLFHNRKELTIIGQRN